MIQHIQSQEISLHSRTYKLPTHPTVIVCIDGFDPDYLTHGIKAGHLPTLTSFVNHGFHTTAKSAMPSLTNPNNLSIITGAPTIFHGVSGNYYLDTETGEEHMIDDAALVKGSTILAELEKAGVRVAAITAKDKLRRILCHGLTFGEKWKGSICFSTQYMRNTTLEENGIEDVEKWLGKKQPEQYSADLSLLVLDAGVKLLQEKKADLLYLTLSDWVQHTFAPDEKQAEDFMSAIDQRLGRILDLGANVTVTGDHGMSDKCNDDGEVNVLFLESVLNDRWPDIGARVICPIADPFVKHHGALGGYVRVHFLGRKPDAEQVEKILAYLKELPHIEVAYTGPEAAKAYETPVEREGDMTVVARKHAVIGGDGMSMIFHYWKDIG